MNKAVEVLSPAGSYECLSAAIKAGADAVYFGIEHLNMRARSSMNFSLEELERISGICSANNVRSYLTLNTVMYDHDIQLMRAIIDKARQSGINAIIASDPAVISYASEVGMELHISTQANVSNMESVRFFSPYADVIVLARELTLRQVARIAEEIEKKGIKGPSGNNIRIELFVHGALCMAVSGKCYLSLHTHWAAANRGACAQNCRRKYIVKDKEDGCEFEIDNEYIMSAKDLCTIEFLDKIINAGVEVLKIEGRGRSADYVYTSTKCYKEALEAVKKNDYSKEKIKSWLEDLNGIYNRGFWEGYYLGRKMGEWSSRYGSSSGKTKVFVGRGMKYFKKIKVGEFKLETGTLHIGDTVYITGPTTGFVENKIKELRINDKAVQSVHQGNVFSMPVDQVVRPSDKLYKVIESR